MILIRVHLINKAIRFQSKGINNPKIHFRSQKTHFNKMKTEISITLNQIHFQMTQNSRIEIIHSKANLEILFQIQIHRVILINKTHFKRLSKEKFQVFSSKILLNLNKITKTQPKMFSHDNPANQFHET